MEFSFGQVEKALALTQNIREDRRSAFANRLKNIQKAGFPNGINTGRGKAARYNAGHVLQLGLLLELNQLGLSPERSITVIESDEHTVAMAFSFAANDGPPKGKFNNPMLLYVDPAALTDLMLVTGEDRSVRSFFYGGLGQFLETLKSLTVGGFQRLSIINVSSLLWRLASQASSITGCEVEDFYEETKVWASPYIHNEPHYARNPKA